MARRLFIIEETFAIFGRGIGLLPGVLKDEPGTHVVPGMTIELRRHDGTRLATRINGIEWFQTPTTPAAPLILPPKITKCSAGEDGGVADGQFALILTSWVELSAKRENLPRGAEPGTGQNPGQAFARRAWDRHSGHKDRDTHSPQSPGQAFAQITDPGTGIRLGALRWGERARDKQNPGQAFARVAVFVIEQGEVFTVRLSCCEIQTSLLLTRSKV